MSSQFDPETGVTWEPGEPGRDVALLPPDTVEVEVVPGDGEPVGVPLGG
ncbi:hypothetical protein [Actinoalloteichus spitiensis]|nr:hypothetical protein [Actinoalloteichus spitiensis]